MATFASKSFGSMSESNIVAFLKKQNKAYRNGKATVSDALYESAWSALQERFPTNPFLRQVGLLPEQGTTVAHVWRHASLDKVVYGQEKAAKALAKFLLMLDDIVMMLPKLDGVSLIVSNGKAVTRGDGLVGTDVSRLLPYLKGLPSCIPDGIKVRCEVVMSKADFATIQDKFNLKNARNTVSGQVNSTKDINEEIASLLHCVAFELLEGGDADATMLQQLQKLQDYSFDVPELHVGKTEQVTLDDLKELYEQVRADCPFDTDGLVLWSPDHVYAPMPLDSKGNPDHMLAFKTARELGETVVTAVAWVASKDGKLVPTVQFEPIDFGHHTVAQATGVHARRILDMGIGVGARILVAYEIIPEITDVLEPGEAVVLPEGTWDENEIHLLGKASEAKRILHFCKKLGIKGIGKAFAKEWKTLVGLLNASHEEILAKPLVAQKKCDTIHASLRKGWRDASWTQRMAASNCFGSGLGERKLALFVLDYETFEIVDASAKGLAEKTVAKYNEGLPKWLAFLKGLSDDYDRSVPAGKATEQEKVVASDKAQDMVVLFTGKRNNTLKEAVLSNLGAVAKTLSGKVTHVVRPDNEYTNKKVEQALEKGLEVWTHAQLDEYLN